MLELKRRPTWDRAAQEALDGFRIPNENQTKLQPPPILKRHWFRAGEVA